MKNLNFMAIAILLYFTTSSSLAQDSKVEVITQGNLTHSLINDSVSYEVRFKDVNDDINLTKRVINKADSKGKLIEQVKINGDIETIGATISIPKGNKQQGYEYEYKPNLQSSSSGSVIVDIKFVKEDPNYKKNSSKATFNFSNKTDLSGKSIDKEITGDKVIFARLYWGGGIAKREWQDNKDINLTFKDKKHENNLIKHLKEYIGKSKREQIKNNARTDLRNLINKQDDSWKEDTVKWYIEKQYGQWALNNYTHERDGKKKQILFKRYLEEYTQGYITENLESKYQEFLYTYLNNYFKKYFKSEDEELIRGYLQNNNQKKVHEYFSIKAKEYKTKQAKKARDIYFNGINDFNKIRFGAPGGKYYDITAEGKDVKWYGSYVATDQEKNNLIGFQFVYQASADVTDIVKKTLGNKPETRTFSAGDIKSTEGVPQNHNAWRDGIWVGGLYPPHMGGWALVIVYDLESSSVQPKGINIYDGLKILAPIKTAGKDSNGNDIKLETETIEGLVVQTRRDSTRVPFSGFYTPISGDIKSSLTVLSFGAKVETNSEDIGIRRDGKEKFKSVEDSSLNRQGGQFNSTISRFGEHMNDSKKYNNQMDLDVYDISKHMSHAQTSAEVELTAKVIKTSDYRTLGERANIGLAAFSTDLYVPEVCFIENLQFRGRNEAEDKAFDNVSTDASKKTIARVGDTLRVQLKIINKGHEAAHKIAIKSILNENSVTYIKDTTHINPSADRNADKFEPKLNKDNENLQKTSNNTIQFLVGRGATSREGGIIDDKNEAHIQFDTQLGTGFNYKDYIQLEANFKNDNINLEYSGAISRCETKNYQLEVAGVSNIVVNDKFKSLETSSRKFFTQLAGRPFNAKLLNIITTTKGTSLGKFDIGDGERLVVDIVSAGGCANGENIMVNAPFEYTKNSEFEVENTTQGINSINILPINNILIDRAYTSLFFRVKYFDKQGNIIGSPSCSSDPFSIRPKEFRFINSKDNSDNFGNLIGGQKYKNIWLKAVDANNRIVENYTTQVKPINFKRSSKVPDTCSNENFDFLGSTTLTANFDNGTGQLRKLRPEGTATHIDYDDTFIYPNIGDVSVDAIDSKWTSIDHKVGASDTDDCVLNSSTIDINNDGKIGCNIETANDLNLKFVPNDISIDNLVLLNFNNGNMTYMSEDSSMTATINFDTIARLHPDSSSKPATLYTKGCYSRNVNLAMDIDTPIHDITDAQGKSLKDNNAKLKQAKSDIIYFAPASANFTKTTNQKDNNSSYIAKAPAFNQGIAKAVIPFNFGRNIQVEKNPFKVTSGNFNFKSSDISDTDGVTGATYIKPANVTNVDFYYGRVYAPDYEGPATGFDANIYYGIFCNGCNPSTEPNRYPLITTTSQTLPQTTSWFVNTEHKDQAQGSISNYGKTLSSTNIKTNITTPIIKNGVEQINLSSSLVPAEDTINMSVPKWLLFNPFDPTAITNNFNVKFYGNVIRWGGRALSEDKKETGVGKIDAGQLNNTSEKTNERLNW